MTDAYIYIRFSTARQEAGSSKERQLADCRAYIERMGWREVEVIADLGRSAWKGSHLISGNLGKFAKRILAHEIPADSVLVVEELDRLSRQEARVALRWIEDVCDTGLQIASAQGNRIYNAKNLTENLLSIFEILMKAQAANEYPERLSRRVKASYENRLNAARESGSAIHSVGPAWLKPIGKRPDIVWEPIPERVKVIREIFDMTLAGKAPWAIAREFNERGEPSFGKARWERTYIVNILRSPAIEGDYVVGEGKNSAPTGEVLNGYYGDPIIPADVVREARAMLDRRRRGSGRNSGAINNIFGQKIRCNECGGRMMTTGYKSRYLVCYDANRGNVCTQRTTFKYHPFERGALDEILHLALDEKFFRQAQKSNHLGLEIAEAEKGIRDKEAEAGRLVSMLSRIESPTTEAKLMEIEAQIARLKATLGDLQGKLALAAGEADAEAHLRRVVSVRDALSDPDDDIRLPARLRVSEALQGLVDHIACRSEGGERVFYLGILNGAHSIWFDNAGRRIGGWEPECMPDNLITKGDPPERAKKVDAYFRRLRA